MTSYKVVVEFYCFYGVWRTILLDPLGCAHLWDSSIREKAPRQHRPSPWLPGSRWKMPASVPMAAVRTLSDALDGASRGRVWQWSQEHHFLSCDPFRPQMSCQSPVSLNSSRSVLKPKNSPLLLWNPDMFLRWLRCCLSSDQWCGYPEPWGGRGHPDHRGQR